MGPSLRAKTHGQVGRRLTADCSYQSSLAETGHTHACKSVSADITHACTHAYGHACADVYTHALAHVRTQAPVSRDAPHMSVRLPAHSSARMHVHAYGIQNCSNPRNCAMRKLECSAEGNQARYSRACIHLQWHAGCDVETDSIHRFRQPRRGSPDSRACVATCAFRTCTTVGIAPYSYDLCSYGPI